MGRSYGQAACRGHNIFFLQIASFPKCLPLRKFGEHRRTGHRWHTAFGQEPDLRDPRIRDSHRKLEDIATRRILDLRAGIGICNFASISRILKVVENLW